MLLRRSEFYHERKTCSQYKMKTIPHGTQKRNLTIDTDPPQTAKQYGEKKLIARIKQELNISSNLFSHSIMIAW